MNICVTANTSWYLLNFRRGLIERLIADGHSVTILAPLEKRYSERLRELGCTFIPISITPDKVRVHKELGALVRYITVLIKRRPDIVFSFTLKPVIFGSVACSLLRIPHVPTLTGLGSFFLGTTYSELLLKVLLSSVLPYSRVVFTQNKDDFHLVQNLNPSNKINVQRVSGSGVNLKHFSYAGPTNQPVPILLMVARLISHKGVREFFGAALELRSRRVNAECRLIGPIGVRNPSAISRDGLETLLADGAVTYLGEVDDVREHIRASSCVVLPSYREGLSRVLMEACAIGRPILTTDVPGCREVVREGINGYLCPPRDAIRLADIMHRFCQLSFEDRKHFGISSRHLAENCFDEEEVINTYLAAIVIEHFG